MAAMTKERHFLPWPVVGKMKEDQSGVDVLVDVD
jgi:hypothetical protein